MRRAARAWLWSALLPVCGFACSEGRPRAEQSRSPAAEPSSAVRPTQAPAPPNAPEPATPRPALGRSQALEHACALRSERALEAAAAWGLAGYLAAEPALLALEADGRTLSLWTLNADGSFAPRASATLEAKVVRAAWECGGSCELAVVDERGRLLALRVDPAQFSSPRVLAQGLDRRFAPALARLGAQVLYAYTASVDEVMHTMLVAVGAGQASAPRDLTPPGHGAAAPTFVLGAAAPTLVMIDARAGISPLLEVAFDARGAAREARVRTPVSQPYAPPLLAAVQAGGEVEVAYSAVGRAAMTAIGRVPLHTASEPTALLPSQGYGELRFGVALSRARAGSARPAALFALEVPSAPAPDAGRKLALKLLDERGARDALGGSGAELEGRLPSLAGGPSPGEFLLVYTRAPNVRAALLACDDP